jgi:Spy/CpxP family protein refolding chaperone
VKKTLLAFTLLTTLGTAMLTAQNSNVIQTQKPSPPTPADMAKMRLQLLNSALSLSPAQAEQALTLFTDAANSTEQDHNNLRTARENLKSGVQANDMEAIDTAAATIGSLAAQITATDAKADAAFYQLLTPEQKARFSNIETRGPFPWFGFGAGAAGPTMIYTHPASNLPNTNP